MFCFELLKFMLDILTVIFPLAERRLSVGGGRSVK